MILLLAALLTPGDTLPPLLATSLEVSPAHAAAPLAQKGGIPGLGIQGPGSGRLPDPRFLPAPLSGPGVLPGASALSTATGAPATSLMGKPGDPEPQLVEYSDAYLTRLKIHKYASYATLPLFAAAYVTGNELINNPGHAASWARNTHGAIAGSLAVLFGVNTVTGLWNLYDARNDPEGRVRRILHSTLLLAADAGFLATAALAGESEEGERSDSGDNGAHRAMAITSMGLALTGYLTMTWPFRRD